MRGFRIILEEKAIIYLNVINELVYVMEPLYFLWGTN
jgi:hypothetical protein